MILIGSYIGVFINVLLPPTVVGAALSIFMIYLFYTTITRGCKFYKEENEDKKKQQDLVFENDLQKVNGQNDKTFNDDVIENKLDTNYKINEDADDDNDELFENSGKSNLKT